MDAGEFVEAGDLQRLMSRAWPGLESARLGAWLLRAGAGYTGRANSALPVGDPGLPLDEALDAVRRFYHDRGLAPKLQVPFPADGPDAPAPGLDADLAARGWTADPTTLVMVAPIAGLDLTASAPAGLRFTLTDAPDAAWLGAYHPRGRTLPPRALEVITAAPAWYLSAFLEGRPAGIGRVAPTGDWVGLQAIEVPPALRRRGVGAAITAALLAHGAARGARHAWLQVLRDNPAVALYRRLGFSIHHAYHYRTAPDASVAPDDGAAAQSGAGASRASERRRR